MSSYEVEFSNAQCDEDDLINDIREAFARAGYQVGDCSTITRDFDTGTACIEIHGDEVDILNDPRDFGWNGIEVTIVGLYDGDLI